MYSIYIGGTLTFKIVLNVLFFLLEIFLGFIDVAVQVLDGGHFRVGAGSAGGIHNLLGQIANLQAGRVLFHGIHHVLREKDDVPAGQLRLLLAAEEGAGGQLAKGGLRLVYQVLVDGQALQFAGQAFGALGAGGDGAASKVLVLAAGAEGR